MNYYYLYYTLGDYLDYGHGRSKADAIKSNHPNSNLLNAMNTFNEKTNSNWKQWVQSPCCNTIPSSDSNKILNFIGNNKKYDFEIYNNQITLNLYSYVALLMTICKTSIPNLDWSWTQYQNLPSNSQPAFFHGQGYGLL